MQVQPSIQSCERKIAERRDDAVLDGRESGDACHNSTRNGHLIPDFTEKSRPDLLRHHELVACEPGALARAETGGLGGLPSEPFE